ncbi:Molybdopterin biosynthesis MoeB protein [Spironucleus salmonicida]|uniref:Molybdopterin biosynthesis MoeB protein n=1 Tax=Spironucleus salmonicida TaxID=348837 RepID=V6LGI7_9EUKA|nr:Molybdopterin biosynthesis MoeB protein [Spironucleus salmonicida]|eukprot:EST43655.1 Molybdopterin biosynthesis MoeB protein [Spironucleus salmonicida]
MSHPLFQRFELAKSPEALKLMQSTKLLLLGCGAVGGMALETLARSGVQFFVLVDFDRFEPSNTNRQVLATQETMGQQKAEVARLRVESINPDAKCVAVNEKVNGARVLELIKQHEIQIVVDCIDLFVQKTEIIQACLDAKMPIVSSMGAARKHDPSKINVVQLDQIRCCALAKRVKSKIELDGRDCKDAVCVLSLEKPAPHPKDADGVKMSLPSYAVMTSMFGIWVGYAAIERIIGGKFIVSKLK